LEIIVISSRNFFAYPLRRTFFCGLIVSLVEKIATFAEEKKVAAKMPKSYNKKPMACKLSKSPIGS
jgi:hypothetical protein